MPTYKVTDPVSGKKITLHGDSPPTEAELSQIFEQLPIPEKGVTLNVPEGAPVSPNIANQSAQEQIPQPPESLKPEHIVEPAATLGSAMVAEPIAGLAGLADMVTGGDNYGQMVQNVRTSMTYSPRTAEGQKGLQVLGEKLQPISGLLQKAQQKLGDMGYEVAGPIGGAIGEMLPTAGLIALGSGQFMNAVGTKGMVE